uniref:Snake toxin/toxin-like domain-containing protein n=1 Tax=Anser cygnoides TaxID=8845 RepID=A0A8B9DSD2_ANSCY
MKPSLLVVLAVALCAERAFSLTCFTCKDASSNLQCLSTTTCSDHEKYCLTTYSTTGLAYPFMCYVCQEQESNKNCLTISMCAKEDKYCVTIRDNVGTSKFLNNAFVRAVEQESQEFMYAKNYPSHQLLGDTDPVAPYCNHCSITKYLIILPGVGAMLMLCIATPGSELQPRAACTASRFSPPALL